MKAKRWVALSAFLGTVSCGGFLTKAGRAQEAVQDLNHHARFGRMAVVSDYVAPNERRAFAERRKDWGGPVRVVDSEIAAMARTTDDRYDVTVRVSWFKPDEGDLHTTDLHQVWEEQKGTFYLTHEEREAGETGLLGEATPKPTPRTKHEDAHFPSVRIPAE